MKLFLDIQDMKERGFDTGSIQAAEAHNAMIERFYQSPLRKRGKGFREDRAGEYYSVAWRQREGTCSLKTQKASDIQRFYGRDV